MSTTIDPMSPKPGPKATGQARTKDVRVPLTEEEYALVRRTFDATDDKVAPWLRDRLLREARRRARARREG